MTISTAMRPVRDELRRIFVDLLRLPPEQLDDEVPFAAHGADSLVLLQASRTIRERLGVSVPFRMLLEEYPTVATLAEHVGGSVPAAPGPPAATVAPAGPAELAAGPAELAAGSPGTPVPVGLPAGPASGDPARGDLMEVVRGQLELMSTQLALLEGAPPAPATEPSSGTAPGRPAGPAPGGHYVPYRPIRPGNRNQLTELARSRVAELVDRLAAKTAASRAAAQTHREWLADERSAARFRLLWKEVQYPLVVSRAKAAIVEDLDGNRYVDLTMGFGALLFGHNPPQLLDILRQQADRGLGLGLSSPSAGRAAQLVRELTGLERVAFVGSGTDAVAVAVRLARTVTGRDRIAVFAGSYHGSNDGTLVRAAGAGDPQGEPIAPGLLPATAGSTVVLEYGSDSALQYLREHGTELAAVLVEPVQSRNPGLRLREFLRELAGLTRERGAALILDEVITGFRTHPGGVQARWGIEADICTFGKVAGGGVPVGIVAGRSRFLDAVDGGRWQYGDDSYPAADTSYVAGTFFRHPLLMPVVAANLERLLAEGPELQQRLEARTAGLVERINAALAGTGAPIRAVSFSSWFVFEFGPEVPVPDVFFLHLLDQGVYVWEGRVCYLSTAHTDQDLDYVVSAVATAAAAMREAGLLGGSPPAPVQLPLTDGQSEVWALSAIEDGAAGVGQLQVTLRLRGQLRTDLLTEALTVLVGRHEALRTSFAADGGTQTVHPAAELALGRHTLATGSAEPAVQEWLAERARVPIDPTRPPLLRADLLQVAPDDHVLALSAHHLVGDGGSLAVIIQELAEHYAAACAGRPAHLPAPESYQDYLRDRLAGSGVDTGQYWWDQHAGSPPLDLPTDRPRPPSRTFRSARVRVPLPDGVAERVRELAEANGATPVAVLLAGYVTLLRALARQDRTVVGVFADDRLAAGGGPLVADAVSLVPLGFDTPAGIGLTELVAQARRRLADGYEHRHFSLRELVRRLGLLADTSRPPLVATTFNLDEEHQPDLGPLQAELSSVPPAAIGVDLAWNVVDAAGVLRVECDYHPDLFDAETVRAWIARYGEILLPDSRPQPGPEPAAPAGGSTARVPVDDEITRELAAAPDRVLVTDQDGDVTAGWLARTATRVAAGLRSHGAGTGSLVGLAFGRHRGLVSGILGTWRAGAAYLPLDPELPLDRLQWMIADSGTRLVVTERSRADQVRSWGAEPLPIEDLARTAGAPPAQVPAPGGGDRLAYVMYTSGSTGRPKGIAVPHSTLAAFATSMLREPGLVSDDVLLAVTTLSFDISLLELIVPLCVGARVVVAGESVTADGAALAEVLQRHQATAMQATPATWQLLVETGWSGRDGLRLLCGGEALPPALAGQLRARAATVWNLYGPTECTVWATVHPVREEPASGAVPIGRAIPGTTAEVLDQALEPTPAAATGELYLGGAGVAWGYLGRPGLTAARFVPDPGGGPGSRRYRTGDLARRSVDGVLTFQGRTDHQVKIRGHRIELSEVEAVLTGHPGVAGCVCLAVDGRLVAYLTPPPGGTVPSVPELRRFAAERLPDYMLPASLVTFSELPLTPNGKVDRAALPAPDGSRPAVAEGYLAPRDEHERTLAAIWSELLGVARIGVHDNFLELGGDSILAVRVAGAARERGIAFSPQQLLRAGSIAELLGSGGGAEPAGSSGVVAPAPAAPEPTEASRWLSDLDIDRISKRLAQENGRRRSA